MEGGRAAFRIPPRCPASVCRNRRGMRAPGALGRRNVQLEQALDGIVVAANQCRVDGGGLRRSGRGQRGKACLRLMNTYSV